MNLLNRTKRREFYATYTHTENSFSEKRREKTRFNPIFCRASSFTPSSLDPLHSFSRIPDWKQRSVSRETREYDLRRDSLERIEKQRRRMTVQNRSREDRMKRRWRDGRARLNEEFGALLAATPGMPPSKNHWIDLSLNRSNHRSYASRLRRLINETNAHCPRTAVGNYVFATASRLSIHSYAYLDSVVRG